MGKTFGLANSKMSVLKGHKDANILHVMPAGIACDHMWSVLVSDTVLTLDLDVPSNLPNGTKLCGVVVRSRSEDILIGNTVSLTINNSRSFAGKHCYPIFGGDTTMLENALTTLYIRRAGLTSGLVDVIGLFDLPNESDLSKEG